MRFWIKLAIVVSIQVGAFATSRWFNVLAATQREAKTPVMTQEAQEKWMHDRGYAIEGD